MATSRLKLPLFKPTDDGKEWLRKFDLLKSHLDWSDDEALFQLSFNLDQEAGTWFSSLPPADKATINALRIAFTTKYVNAEPKLVTEAKLSARKLLTEESIDSLINDLTVLGTKLNKSQDDLANKFIQCLPDEYKSYVLGTDTHNWESYTTRARLYESLIKQKNVTDAALPVQSYQNDCQELIDQMKVMTVSWKQDHDKLHMYRQRSRDREKDRSRNKSRDRSKGRSYRDRSGSRERRYSRERSWSRPRDKRVSFDGCYVCGGPHKAMNCDNKFKPTN